MDEIRVIGFGTLIENLIDRHQKLKTNQKTGITFLHIKLNGQKEYI